MLWNLRRTPGLLCLPILFVACFTGSLFAQEHSYMHYDVNDGLAGSTVYCMAQDKDGFMWFGTETGVSRFDGTHFRNFTTGDGLPDNEVLNMFVDSRNRVWLLPFKSTIAYYSKGLIHDQRNDPLLARLNIGSNVLSVLEDGAGNIMVREMKVLHIIHPDGKISDISTFMGAPLRGTIQVGLNSRQGFRVCLNHDVGIVYVDVVGDTLAEVKDVMVSHRNSSLTSYTGPYLEVYTNVTNLLFQDPLTYKKFSIRLPEGFISISHIDDSSLALNTYRNSYLFNTRQRKITDSFLKDQTVNGAMEDTEGSLWFSTLGKGVYRLGSMEVKNYALHASNTDLAVFCIKEFDSVLYIGCDHFFLWTLDRRNGKMTSRQVFSEVTRGRIMSIVRPSRSKVLLGIDDGIFEMTGKDFRLGRMLEGRAIKTLSLINDSIFLECSGFNVRYVRLKDYQGLDTLWPARGTCAFMKDGACYVGTPNGLYVIDKNKGTTSLGNQFSILKSRIAALDESGDGTLWIATDGEGLVGYKDGKVVARLSQDQGLTSNSCRNLFISGHTVWVGTDKGLNKVDFNGDRYKITSYTRADGLSSDIVNAIYVSGDEVFVGTSEGMTAFNDTKISKRSGCNLKITGITISDRKWLIDTSGFVLRHADNIQFEFAGVSYKSSGSILYQYRLIGLDSAWKTTRESLLSYPSLPSGPYELQLFATNKFGVKSGLTDIKFTIDKLLRERTWFRLVVFLSLAILVWLTFTYRIRSIRKKEAEKTGTVTRIAELEQMALRSQMNPHFIFNCLNSIQEYVIDKDIRGANEFITKFSYLIRQTLDISAKPFISLYEEINYISTYMELENRRFGNKFVSSVTVSDEIDKQSMFIPPMILQPYIENGIRHGIGHRQDKNGRIQVKMECCADRLLCIIEDNGVGRRQATLYKSANAINYQSMGMTLVARRIDMLNKTNKTPILIGIEDLEGPASDPTGTRITLSFPMEKVTK